MATKWISVREYFKLMATSIFTKHRAQDLLIKLSSILSVLLFWHILLVLVFPASTIIPTPSEVFIALFDIVTKGDIFAHVFASLIRVVVGFLIATFIGVGLALVAGYYKKVGIFLNPLIEFLRPIPPIAWIPIAILIFGLGNTSAYFIVFMGAFFPIFTNSFFGVNSLPTIYENVARSFEIKKSIFKEMESICGSDTILATNTSSLSITEIAAVLKNQERFLGIHFFNPAPLMKLVEVVKGINTKKEYVDKITDIVKNLDKEYVTVNESCGFIVNRLLIPMINEAIAILAESTSSAEDIDKAMKYGANHPIGPLSLADMIGNDIVLAIMNNLYEEFNDTKYRPNPLLKKMVRAGLLGRKTGEGFFKY